MSRELEKSTHSARRALLIAMRRNIAFVALVTAMLYPGPAGFSLQRPAEEAADTVPTFVRELDDTLSHVVSGGAWFGDSVWRHRVVVFTYGREHMNSRVYAQWLGPGDTERTVPVPSLSDIPFSIVNEVTVISRTNATVFLVKMNHEVEPLSSSYHLTLGAPGDSSVDRLREDEDNSP